MLVIIIGVLPILQVLGIQLLQLTRSSLQLFTSYLDMIFPLSRQSSLFCFFTSWWLSSILPSSLQHILQQCFSSQYMFNPIVFPLDYCFHTLLFPPTHTSILLRLCCCYVVIVMVLLLFSCFYRKLLCLLVFRDQIVYNRVASV